MKEPDSLTRQVFNFDVHESEFHNVFIKLNERLIKNYFFEFIPAIRQQVSERLNSRGPYLSYDWIEHCVSNQGVYVSPLLERYVSKFLKDYEIKTDSITLALIACYFVGLKKIQINLQEGIQLKYNKHVAATTFLNSIEDIRNGKLVPKYIVAWDTNLKEEVDIKFPAGLNYNSCFESLEMEVAKTNPEKGFVAFCKNEREIFIDGDLQFKITFRKVTSALILRYLKDFTEIEKPLDGNSSSQQREVIGLFYHLLYLDTDNDAFFKNESLPSESFIIKDSTIHKDLKTYGKF